MPDTTQPTSEKKFAANRANAARSTGPRTPEGKARSALNSLQHGFAAAKFCAVRFDRPVEFATLFAKAVATWRPVNDQERIAVERIALAQLSLYRCAALEAGLTTAAMNESFGSEFAPAVQLTDAVKEGVHVTEDQNRAFNFAMGFERLVHRTDAWKYFLRYYAQAERFYRRALDEFERLKLQRSELPNEPTDDAECQQIASLILPEPAPDEPNEPNEPTEPPPPQPIDDPTTSRPIPLFMLSDPGRTPKRRNRASR